MTSLSRHVLERRSVFRVEASVLGRRAWGRSIPVVLAAVAFLVTAAVSDRARAAEPSAPPPAGGAAGTTDDAAPETATESGGGLFEQSQTAAGAATAGAAGAPAEAASIDPRRFTVVGYSRGGMFVGKVPGAQLGEMKAAYGELSMAVKTRRETYGDGYAEARLRYGLQAGQQQNVAELREAYADAYLGPIDLRLGKQIIVWGRADALNPTNNLMPFDIRVRSPIEDDRRLGNVAARASLHLGPVRLEGVWIPLYLPSELPDLPLPQYVSFGDPTNPRNELRNTLSAARLHLELPAFEMSVSYVHGFAPLPGLFMQSLTIDPNTPSVIVSRTAYDQQVLGFDFSTALGSVLAVRGEAAYRLPTDYKNRYFAARPDLQYVLGVDRSFGPVSVIAQYMGRYVLDWQKEEGAAGPVDPSSLKMMPSDTAKKFARDIIVAVLKQTNQMLFSQTARVQHLATARLEWLTAHDTLSISLLGLYNFTTREWLAEPKIGYHLSDALVAYVGGEIFHGPSGTLFGVIDELLSAGYAELRYTF
jgi:hypothetical protein